MVSSLRPRPLGLRAPLRAPLRASKPKRFSKPQCRWNPVRVEPAFRSSRCRCDDRGAGAVCFPWGGCGRPGQSSVGGEWNDLWMTKSQLTSVRWPETLVCFFLGGGTCENFRNEGLPVLRSILRYRNRETSLCGPTNSCELRTFAGINHDALGLASPSSPNRWVVHGFVETLIHQTVWRNICKNEHLHLSIGSRPLHQSDNMFLSISLPSRASAPFPALSAPAKLQG